MGMVRGRMGQGDLPTGGGEECSERLLSLVAVVRGVAARLDAMPPARGGRRTRGRGIWVWREGGMRQGMGGTDRRAQRTKSRGYQSPRWATDEWTIVCISCVYRMYVAEQRDDVRATSGLRCLMPDSSPQHACNMCLTVPSLRSDGLALRCLVSGLRNPACRVAQ